MVEDIDVEEMLEAPYKKPGKKEAKSSKHKKRDRSSSSPKKSKSRHRSKDKDRRKKKSSRNHRSSSISSNDGNKYSVSTMTNAPKLPLTEEERDARTIFCMQLPKDARYRDIERYFSKCGRIKDIRMISDRNSRKSKGICYVEFDDIETVSKAMALNGQKFLGAPIVIQPTMSEKNRYHMMAINTVKVTATDLKLLTKVYVGSLHHHITDEMLKAIFEPFGHIENVQLAKDASTNRSKGFGFVFFRDAECAKRAIDQLDGFELAGKPMKVCNVTEGMEAALNEIVEKPIDDPETKLNNTSMPASNKSILTNSVLMNKSNNSQPLLTITNGNGAISSQTIIGSIKSLATTMSTSSLSESPCLVLSNMFEITKQTKADWHLDVQREVKAIVNSVCKVIHLHLDKNSTEGNIYMKVQSAEGANNVIKTLNSEAFSGRIIKVAKLPLSTYNSLFPNSQ